MARSPIHPPTHVSASLHVVSVLTNSELQGRHEGVGSVVQYGLCRDQRHKVAEEVPDSAMTGLSRLLAGSDTVVEAEG